VSELRLLDGRFAICRLAADAEVPEWAAGGAFSSVTRTHDELSVVCAESLVPEGTTRERGWRIFQVAGPMEFSLIGVLEAIAAPLARTGVSIFAISTFDTDYFLVKDASLSKAVDTLCAAGHRIA
jgi:hypothetical protein